MIFRFLLAATLAVLAPLASAQQPASQAEQASPREPEQAAITVYDAVVVKSYPHDPTAFTQGLLWHDGWLYESTGRPYTSAVRKVDLETGEVAINRPIPAPQFGEGLALWDDELISLTWRDGVVHRWRLEDIGAVRSYADYPYEGWGLARLSNQLVASDGTSALRFLDPETYEVERTIRVTFNGQPLPQLNELEVVDGLILANVWYTDYIVGIDPETGAVRKLIDCRLLPGSDSEDRDAVLNGIAWDAEGERLFVTGKLWPQLHQIELKARGALN